jgi:hypothetical protein
MLPLSSPGEAGSPSVKDLVKSHVEGEGEGALKEGATARPCYQDSGELLQHGLEVGSTESHPVEGERDQAASGGGLDGAYGASVGPELNRFSNPNNIVEAFSSVD